MSEVHKNVTAISGFQVDLEINYRNHSVFKSEVEEGHVIEAPDLEKLTEKIMAWCDRQKKSKRKKHAIPLLKWTADRDVIRAAKEGGSAKNRYGYIRKTSETPHRFIDCIITGLHSGNGNPIVKVGKAHAKVESFSYKTGWYRPMTDEEKTKFLDLFDIAEKAGEEFEEFRDRFEIDSLDSYAKEEVAKAEKRSKA
jgi:hypothetical protein